MCFHANMNNWPKNNVKLKNKHHETSTFSIQIFLSDVYGNMNLHKNLFSAYYENCFIDSYQHTLIYKVYTTF